MLNGGVVGYYKKMRTSFQVVPPVLNGADNGQQLLFMHRVLALCRYHTACIVLHRLKASALVL